MIAPGLFYLPGNLLQKTIQSGQNPAWHLPILGRLRYRLIGKTKRPPFQEKFRPFQQYCATYSKDSGPLCGTACMATPKPRETQLKDENALCRTAPPDELRRMPRSFERAASITAPAISSTPDCLPANLRTGKFSLHIWAQKSRGIVRGFWVMKILPLFLSFFRLFVRHILLGNRPQAL